MIMNVFALLLIISSGGILTAITAAETAPGPVVPNHTITYHGHVNNSVESSLNIRYGQDTSGQARFTRPQPYTYPQDAVVNASVIGAAYPQSITSPPASAPGSTDIASISEDCLTLCVDQVENTTDSALLPVMVFLYGGGWTVGEIYSDVYNL